MKGISIVLLLLLSCSLGGVQVFHAMGKSAAHQRARRMQRRRVEHPKGLDTLILDKADFHALKKEALGHGIFEFSHHGVKYDAFDVVEDGAMVRIVVGRDGFETALDALAMAAVSRTTTLKQLQSGTIKRLVHPWCTSLSNRPIAPRHAGVVAYAMVCFLWPLAPVLNVDVPPPEELV